MTDRRCSYSFTLKLGQSFNFSLTSEKGAPPKAKPKRSPSYLRRQLRRREDFLKKRSGSSAENVDAAPRHTQDNIVCRQGGADLLDKKIASSGQTAATEVESVDKDCSLDLNPNPSYPRGSDESLESDDSSENVFSSESSQVKNNQCRNCLLYTSDAADE